MSIDLGQYQSEYSHIFKVKRKYSEKIIEDDSPIKLYEAHKGGERVLLKIIDKEKLQKEEDYDFLLEGIQKEIELTNLCNSENVIKFNKTFETEKNIVFEMEFCDSDLKEFLYQNGPLENKMVGKNNLQTFREITINIATALKHIHEKGIVHRNIKPYNISIQNNNNGKGIAKLSDFSSAIYIKDINDSVPVGTVFYMAPEIKKNLDYTEKCDIWSAGLTLFEIYFGVLPYGWNPNIKKINEMIYDEKKFVFRKSEIPTLDILFKRLLQINPENRMTTSEFYEYVTNENFLLPDAIMINNDEKYLNIYQEILSLDQIDYGDQHQLEKLSKSDKEKHNMKKILSIVEDGNLPDIMNFADGIINQEEKFNNIIYYESNAGKHKEDINSDSDKFEKLTPGAFILCTDLDSLAVIRDEILKHRKCEKKTIFNIISNGRGYKKELKQFLMDNPQFKQCLNKLCIYCLKPSIYEEDKNNDPNFIHLVTTNPSSVIEFIKEFSTKENKPFPLTKLVTLSDYQEKYKERHKKISLFYGDLKKESFEEQKEKIKKEIQNEKLMQGLLTFDIDKDLEALDELIIKEYTKNTFHGDLNRWLMKGKMKDYEPVAYFTSRLMYSLNSYAKKKEKFCNENKKVLHRGAKLYYSCLLPYVRALGKIILLSGFTSTSDSDKVAETWAGRGKENEVYQNSSKFSVVFHITNLHYNNWISNGVDVHDISQYTNEKEVLFQPFSFYKVTNVDFDVKGHKADISLETVGKKEILEMQIKENKEIQYNPQENIMEVC